MGKLDDIDDPEDLIIRADPDTWSDFWKTHIQLKGAAILVCEEEYHHEGDTSWIEMWNNHIRLF